MAVVLRRLRRRDVARRNGQEVRCDLGGAVVSEGSLARLTVAEIAVAPAASLGGRGAVFGALSGRSAGIAILDDRHAVRIRTD